MTAIDLREAFATLDADAITRAIDAAFPRAVRAAIERHQADGTIALLSPEDASADPEQDASEED